jgi:hypothetical protein
MVKDKSNNKSLIKILKIYIVTNSIIQNHHKLFTDFLISSFVQKVLIKLDIFLNKYTWS